MYMYFERRSHKKGRTRESKREKQPLIWPTTDPTEYPDPNRNNQRSTTRDSPNDSRKNIPVSPLKILVLHQALPLVVFFLSTPEPSHSPPHLPCHPPNVPRPYCPIYTWKTVTNCYCLAEAQLRMMGQMRGWELRTSSRHLLARSTTLPSL